MIKFILNNKWVLTGLMFIKGEILFAQDNGIEMAEALRESGKIYVVVAVLLIIFAGIVVYLVSLDRRISKMEKNIK